MSQLSARKPIAELVVTDEARFGAWIVIGLAIYVFSGYRHSRMRSN